MSEPELTSDPGEHAAPGEHIHLPPNSLVPICVALSITFTFTGLLIPLKPRVGPVIIPVIALLGIVALVISCVAWFRAARNEYRDLPR
jgi:hypothetical protein